MSSSDNKNDSCMFHYGCCSGEFVWETIQIRGSSKLVAACDTGQHQLLQEKVQATLQWAVSGV